MRRLRPAGRADVTTRRTAEATKQQSALYSCVVAESAPKGKPVEPGARASVWELGAALFGSLLVLPVALFATALGLGGVEEESSEAVLWALLIAIPLAAWGAVVVFLVRYWLRGYRRLWSFPLVVVVGFFFWPLLLLLINSKVRKTVLPYPPPPRPKTADRSGPGVLRRHTEAADTTV